ncbi:MAG: sulfatase-like hydrolase/transferase [Myxococcales bacterium]|nr:sulfatase-like hydrolase/transferase [Myxococcales bacterium]
MSAQAPVSAQPPAPAWLRRALGFLCALLLAKLLLVLLRVADGGARGLASPWTPAVMIYRDLWLLLSLAGLDAAASWLVRARAGAARVVSLAMGALYLGALGYCAFNVPVARTMSTPLTALILGAAGGALSDSIKVYVTFGNIASIVAVIACGVIVAWRVRRRPSRRAATILATLLVAALLLGPLGLGRVESLGLHRNALLTLLRTALAQRDDARSADASARRAWRERLPAAGARRDLSHLRGAARGRDVLWIVLESTGARYLAPYGARHDPTPNLTRLVRRSGLLFESAYATYPESIKGLWSVLCARAPTPNTSAAEYAASKLSCKALPAVLRARGYRTALFHSGRFVYLGMRHIVDARGFDVLRDAGDIKSAHASSFGVDERSTVKALLGWLDGLPRGARFFAMYMPIAGHHPYSIPGGGPSPFGSATDTQRYLSDLFRGDLALGELLSGLAARGRLARTLVVVHGDHGQAFFQHEGNFAHTLFIYEENVRVPLYFIVPGALTGLTRAPQLASLTDVAPTTLALLGLAAPTDWRGRSLLGADSRAVRFYTDHGVLQLGLRHGRYKYILEPRSGRQRLFDLDNDPAEKKDVATQRPRRAARYRGSLSAP